MNFSVSYLAPSTSFIGGANNPNSFAAKIGELGDYAEIHRLATIEDWDKQSDLIIESNQITAGHLLKFFEKIDFFPTDDIRIWYFNHAAPLPKYDNNIKNSYKPGPYDLKAIHELQTLIDSFDVKVVYQLEVMKQIHNLVYSKPSLCLKVLEPSPNMCNSSLPKITSHNNRFLYVSGYDNQFKGLQSILYAWDLLPLNEFELYIVGDCISPWIQKKFRYTLERGDVHIEGMQRDLKPYYESCDNIFMLSSIESYSYTAYEAISWKKHLIGLNVHKIMPWYEGLGAVLPYSSNPLKLGKTLAEYLTTQYQEKVSIIKYRNKIGLRYPYINKENWIEEDLKDWVLWYFKELLFNVGLPIKEFLPQIIAKEYYK